MEDSTRELYNVVVKPRQKESREIKIKSPKV